MALINCPECGKKISDKATACPDCGCPINVTSSNSSTDPSTSLDNLFILARRAKEEKNATKASSYYEQILLSKPDCWEAYFYSTYFSAMNSKKGELYSTVTEIINCETNAFRLIAENVNFVIGQKKAVSELLEALNSIAVIFKNTLDELCIQFHREPGLFKSKEYYTLNDPIQYKKICPLIVKIFYNASKAISQFWGNEFGVYTQKCRVLCINLLNSLIFECDGCSQYIPPEN